MLQPTAFRHHSGLDLLVEGLSATSQLEALGLVEGVLDRALVRAGEPGIAIDLALDLDVEAPKFDGLVDSLEGLGRVDTDRWRVDAAALRLQSFCTGIECCLVQMSRVLSGGIPDGEDWHRRLLERMGQPSVDGCGSSPSPSGPMCGAS